MKRTAFLIEKRVLGAVDRAIAKRCINIADTRQDIEAFPSRLCLWSVKRIDEILAIRGNSRNIRE